MEMLTLLAATIVLLIGKTSCCLKSSSRDGARTAGQELLFNFNEMIVNPNEMVQLDCGIKGDYRYCVWEKDRDIFQVEDVYESIYSGMHRPENTEGNQCGIVVDQATIEDHGVWTCKIYIRGTALVGSKNVVITVRPTKAEVSPHQVIVNAGDLQGVECSVMAARPAVKIIWTLNGRDITSDSLTEERPTNPDGTYMTLSTLRRNFSPEENGQKLECVVAHHTYAEPDITTIPITVVYAPIHKPAQTFYQIPLHSDYEVRLNFSANPRPTSIEWSYGANFNEMPNIIQIPRDTGKFATILNDFGNGNYQAVLRVAEITKENFDTRFKLHVANDIGEADYLVALSMNEKPIEPLSNGTIVGIMVLLLLIVIVICAAGYARYKQKFCFGSKARSKAYIDQEGGNDDNGNANDGIKRTNDHINGNTPAPNGIINGNGNENGNGNGNGNINVELIKNNDNDHVESSNDKDNRDMCNRNHRDREFY